MVDDLIDRIEQQTLGCKATVVATGGLSRVILPLCRHDIIFDDDLLLDGLWQLYKKNAK